MINALSQNMSHALRQAPVEQQKKILDILDEWPIQAGQSTQSYSRALRAIVARVVQAWGGVWLDPEQRIRPLTLQCAKGHTLVTTPSALRQGIWCFSCYVDSLRDSIETMQQLAAKKQGKCLSSTYHNGHTKLQWECKRGHTWEMSPISVKDGNWCTQCHIDERQSHFLKEIQSLALERSGECLSEQYIDVQTKMMFKCAYGHIWQTAPGSIKSSKSWCPVCRYDKKRNSLTHFHVLAAAKGGLCLTKKQVLAKEPVEWQCAKGHIWKAASSYVRLGSWCPQCAKSQFRLTIKDIQQLAKSRGGKCLSVDYHNTHEKLLWACKLGHIWSSSLDNVKYKSTWCPQCAILARCKYEQSKRKYLPDKRKVLDVHEDI